MVKTIPGLPGSASYGSASYGSASYGSASYGSASYGSASYGSASYGGRPWATWLLVGRVRSYNLWLLPNFLTRCTLVSCTLHVGPCRCRVR
jgi:hypothetical protein